ncbi:unnamed protein product, partial [Rotaria magnacalcarata]
MKTQLTSSIVQRSGSSYCISTVFIGGVGMTCCQSDLCNAAQPIHQVSIL